jgi:hemolysin-activating ACP:hemolysin acyltransferase
MVYKWSESNWPFYVEFDTIYLYGVYSDKQEVEELLFIRELLARADKNSGENKWRPWLVIPFKHTTLN